MQIPVTETTLWDLLTEPLISLRLPRFGLFLMIALLFEIYCDRKKVCLRCSLSTVTLQLLTGVGGIVAIFYMVTGAFSIGDRVIIPVWYYPLTLTSLSILTALFLKGVRQLFRERFVLSGVIRCIIYAATLYFAVATITTPTKLNRSLAQWERDAQSQQPAPE